MKKFLRNSLEGEIALLFVAYLFFALTSLRHIFWGVSKSIPVRFIEQGAVSVYAADVFYVLLLIAFLLEIFFVRKIKLRFSLLTLAIIIFALIVLLRAAATFEVVAVYNAFRILQAISVYFIAKHVFCGKPQIRKSVMLSILWISLFQAIIGIGQTLLGHDLGLRFLGEPVLSLSMAGVAKVGDGVKILRSYGTALHPNVYASFLLIPFYLLIFEGIISKKVLKITAAAIIIIGVILSFSRAAYVGLLILVIWKLFKDKKPKYILGLSAIFLAMIGGLVLTKPQLIGALKDRVVPPRTDMFLIDRALMLSNSAVFRDKLLFGVGPGMYVFELFKRVPENSLNPWQFEYPHSMPVAMALETGIPIIIPYLYFFYKGVRSKQGILLISIIPLVLFDHFFWTLQTGIIVFWLVLAIVLSSGLSEKMFDRKIH